MERYPDVFRLLFKDKECSIYKNNDEGFMRGMTSQSPELVCENEITVIRKIFINNLYLRLLDEESGGDLIIRRYEDNADYKSIVSDYIVNGLICFEAVYTESERLKKHYGKLIDALQNIMDGHLL